MKRTVARCLEVASGLCELMAALLWLARALILWDPPTSDALPPFLAEDPFEAWADGEGAGVMRSLERGDDGMI